MTTDLSVYGKIVVELFKNQDLAIVIQFSTIEF